MKFSLSLLFALVVSFCFSQTKIKTKDITKPKTITTASGLEFTLTTSSNGKLPKNGDLIEAHYTGKFLNDSVFDSSVSRGVPFKFRLGMNQVIKGWDEAFLKMKIGEKAKLKIPPSLAYGDQYAGPIPPNSTLLFEVELLNIIPAPTPYNIKGKKEITTPEGIKYYIVQENASGLKPKAGDQLKVQYSGYFANGKLFDSSIGGEPAPFSFGTGKMIRGFEIALQHFRKGEKARFIIPYMLAYGEEGYPGVIPAKADLTFDVEIVDVIPPPSAVAYDVTGKDTLTTESGLKYIVVKKGTGAKAQNGKMCTVHYSGYFLDGNMFDSSVKRGQPFQFTLGSGQVIKGWDEGVALMNIGDKIRFIVPYQMAYGEQGRPPQIPPRSTLVFDVEFMDMR